VMATFHRGYATVLDGALQSTAQVNAARAAAEQSTALKAANE
jgi:hypothetical protein